MAISYKRHRFPREIISHTMWLYHRFALSLRDVSEILSQRGIFLSYEAIRYWAKKFGLSFAREIKKRSPQRGDKWHLDEVCLAIKGQKYWLWRAVDQDGYELDILLQSRRNFVAAKRFFQRLLQGLAYIPRVLITDKLRSYNKARNSLIPHTEHRQHKGLNNRAENSHQPTRQQERKMRKFKSPPQAQRFLVIHGSIQNLFKVGRYKHSANHYRQLIQNAHLLWQEVTSQVNYV